MKLLVPLALVLVGASAIAQNSPAIWPMPSPFPVIPKDANTATYPAPRMEWFERVVDNVAQARKKADSINLIFEGDSITDAWQGTGREVWAQHYAKLGAFDFGIGGDRTQHVLWRLAQGQAEGTHPKLIALLIGTNNLGANTDSQIADGVKEIINTYQTRCPNAVILLQGIFPREEKPTHPWRARIKAINEMISKFADGKKVVYLDFSDKFLNPDGTMSPEIMPDFLHPSAKGYKIWADAIQPVIDKYFPQQ
jgi:lysophospholipase L1-like esterase